MITLSLHSCPIFVNDSRTYKLQVAKYMLSTPASENQSRKIIHGCREGYRDSVHIEDSVMF